MSLPSPHKKRRPVRSCTLCRTRRVKCDQLRPACTNCVKARASCEYPQTPEERVITYSTPPTVPGSVVPLHQDSASGTSRESDATAVPEDSAPFRKTLGGKDRYWGPSFWGSSGRELPEFEGLINHQAADGPDPSLLCEGCEHLRHWEKYENLPIVRLLTDEALRCDRVHGLGQMLDRLPDRETCNRLWAQFVATVYPLVPVFHLPTFWQQIDSFWNSVQQYEQTGLPDGVLAECPAFLALVFSTLCCGALPACAVPRLDTPRELKGASRLSRNLYRATMQTLIICGFPRNPTIAALQAFVICHIPLIREESERSVSFVSTAFRVGQTLGLHRDPRHFNMGPVEAEVRRRLWWHILHKDTLSSSVSGLPQMMWHRQQHDTAMISELQDVELNDSNLDQLQIPESRRSSGRSDSVVINGHTAITDYRKLGKNIDIRQLVSVGRFLTTNIMRDILGRHAELEPWIAREVLHFQDAIEQTAIQVRGRVEALELSTNGPVSTNQGPAHFNPKDSVLEMRQQSIHAWGIHLTAQSSAFAAWSRKLLNLMIEKAHCALYHPLQKGPNQHLWQQFRQTAMIHFHAYIEQYVELCTEPAFAPFHWMYPGNYQPLQAMAVMLTDLLDDPTSSEAAQSRRLVDCIFSLLGNDGGVVFEQSGHLLRRRLPESGKECWAMLAALRRRAWRAMGVDPSVIWTCARKHDHETNESESSDASEQGQEERPEFPREQRQMNDAASIPTASSHRLSPGNDFDFGLEYGTLFDDLFVEGTFQ